MSRLVLKNSLPNVKESQFDEPASSVLSISLFCLSLSFVFFRKVFFFSSVSLSLSFDVPLEIMIRKVKLKTLHAIINSPTLSFFSFMLMFGHGREKKVLSSPILVCFLHSQINTRNNCALHARISSLSLSHAIQPAMFLKTAKYFS